MLQMAGASFFLLASALEVASAAGCQGARTFSEARDLLWVNTHNWTATRPGMARQNWSEYVPGTIILPDNISFGMNVYGVHNVDTQRQTLTVDVMFRRLWTDPRLQFTRASDGGCFTNPLSTEGELAFAGSPEGEIWTPGVAIHNQDGEPEVQYSAWWIYPSGLVWWSFKAKVKLKCKFDFSDMPYDLLSCPLRIVGWRDLYYDITLKFDTGSTNAQIVGLQEGVDEEWNLYNVTGRIADPSHSGFVVGGHGVEWVFQIARRFKYYERYFLWPIHILVLFAWTSGPRSPPRLLMRARAPPPPPAACSCAPAV